MARSLNATQRQRARAKLATRKGIRSADITDTMIDNALNLGELRLSDCGSSSDTGSGGSDTSSGSSDSSSG